MTVQQHATSDPTERNLIGDTDVLMVSMPFGPLYQPSIGLSLLKATLAPRDLRTSIHYFTLQFADLIGSPLYTKLANGYPVSYDLVGEWIFAAGLFGTGRIDDAGYIEDVLRGRSPDHRFQKPVPESFITDVQLARAHVEPFLDACLQEVLARRPRVVGFTSVFQQQTASLALAKRIKAHAPDIQIVFGGANCEGVMGVEMLRQFPFVDAVVSGEGELVFVELIARLLDRRPLDDLQGVYSRAGVGPVAVNGRYPNTPSVRDMDSLPVPDYADYFEQFERAGFIKARPRVLFETSRGCWWGEKNHCTFCGLNGITMTFRSKSASRALDELVTLAARHPESAVSVVDNIMDMDYFKDFIPALAERDLGLELFYEVKANLKKDQLRLMRDAGITQIQPGIESFSNQVLKLMRKGVSGLQNIQLLKWCKELGVWPSWNILWGFPGESPEEYERLAEMIPALTHLCPPGGAATIRLDRFSPNFDQAEALGFADVAPYPAYRYVYPLEPQAVANLAYFFTFRYQRAQDVSAYVQPVLEAVSAWKQSYETSDLFSVDKGRHLLLWDLRPAAGQALTVLCDAQRLLYQICDRATSLRQLQQVLAENNEAAPSQADIEALLQPLVDQRLMLRENNTFLSLAVPLGEYNPKKPILERFMTLVQVQGTSSGDEITIPLGAPARQVAEPVSA